MATLSKNDFLEFLRCPKNFWLMKRRGDLYVDPELSEFEQQLLNQGQEVEACSRHLFPGGTMIAGLLEDMLEQTRELVTGKVSPLFQVTFLTDDGLLVKVDILEYDPKEKVWNIYEVKSSSQVKTDRKHNHLKDVGFQKIVLERSGIPVGETFIIHVNKEYVRRGDLDVGQLFIKKNVSEDVAADTEITSEIEEALELLSSDGVDITECPCLYLTRSNHCSSFSVLNKDIPEYSVHDISRITPARLKELLGMGAVDIKDVPANASITPIQRTQVSLAQSGKPKIEQEKVEQFLKELEYPIYFLDYETFMAAIPPIDGFSPHQHLAFQASIHVLDQEDKLTHYMYLAKAVEGAEEGLIDFLENAIGTSGNLISWHKSFEGRINNEMADRHPKHREFLSNINDRTVDLEVPFKKYYLHPDFHGKTSLKVVLPVLVPGLSYAGLGIQDGTAAMESWRQMISGELSEEKANQIKADLLKYAELDTLAMVEIFKVLQKA